MTKREYSSIQRGVVLTLVLLACVANIQKILAASDSVNVGQSVFFEGEPPVPPEEEPKGGISLPINATPPEIYDVNIWDITSESVRISWRNDEVSLSELSYGEDRSYSTGKIIDHPDSYEDFSEFYLENLKPSTRYYLKLKSKNSGGAEIIVTSYSFSTLPKFDLPDNVGSLFARQEGLSVILSWKNPKQNFSGVQINRSVDAFAGNKNDGEIIFMGNAENFVDKDVINKTQYYYTIFSYDSYGNFSSGVSISIKTDFVGNPTPIPEPPGGEVRIPSDVENLQIVSDAEKKNIMLFWKNPKSESSFEIEIRKDNGFPPLTPQEGQLVYKGTGDKFIDDDVQDNSIYYYAVFVRSSENVYSKGKLIAANLKGLVEFDINEEWKRMKFVDVESGVLLNQNEETIKYLPGRSLGVGYSPGHVLDGVKSIVIELDNAFYDLDFNEKDGVYQTSLIAPFNEGRYIVSVIFLDFNDKLVYKKNLNIDIVNSGRVYKEEGRWLSRKDLSSGNLSCFFSEIFGDYRMSCFDKVGVEAAEISIFYRNSQDAWEFWDATKFNQKNPYITGSDGGFYLFLPDGEYKLLIRKSGFKDEEIFVNPVDNLVNVEIKILGSRRYDYAIFILLTILFIAFIVRKKIIVRRKRKIIF